MQRQHRTAKLRASMSMAFGIRACVRGFQQGPRPGCCVRGDGEAGKQRQ